MPNRRVGWASLPNVEGDESEFTSNVQCWGFVVGA